MPNELRKPFEFFLYDSRTGAFTRLHHGTVVGRTEGELRFPSDDRVSKAHCRFSIVGNEIYVEDFQSTNLTRVNGAPIQARRRRRILLNDVIEIGSQHLVVTHQDRRNPGRLKLVPTKPVLPYRAVRRSDGSLAPVMDGAGTKRTLVDVSWAQMQRLRLASKIRSNQSITLVPARRRRTEVAGASAAREARATRRLALFGLSFGAAALGLWLLSSHAG